jgi:hypothetical protein
VLLHGWMDVAPRSSSSSTRWLRRRLRALGAGARLARLRPDQRAGGDSYWFPDYLGDLDALLDRTRLARAAGRPARPQHGRQRGDATPACGRSASAGWSTWKASACPPPAAAGAAAAGAVAGRAEEARAPAPLRHLAAVAARLRQEQPAADARQGRLAGAALGAAGGGEDGSGNCRPTRRTSASTRCSTRSTRCWRPGSHHRAAAVGGRRADRHRQVVGPPLFRAEFHQRLTVMSRCAR